MVTRIICHLDIGKTLIQELQKQCSFAILYCQYRGGISSSLCSKIVSAALRLRRRPLHHIICFFFVLLSFFRRRLLSYKSDSCLELARPVNHEVTSGDQMGSSGQLQVETSTSLQHSSHSTKQHQWNLHLHRSTRFTVRVLYPRLQHISSQPSMPELRWKGKFRGDDFLE